MWLLHDKNEGSKCKVMGLVGSSVPTSVILTLSAKPHIQELGIAFVRVLKLCRLHQVDNYFEKRDRSNRKQSLPYVRTVQATLYILMATHIIGCIWLLVGRIEPNIDKGWLVLVRYDELNAPITQMYIDSVFLVFSTMSGLGFGWIYPRTILEYFF